MSNAMSWSQFLNSGASAVNPAVTLGVMPQGQLLNAMEIVFREEDDAATRRRALARGGYSSYRVRQSVEERDFQFVNGWLDWSSKAAGTADDPDPGVQSWAPPFLKAYDTPGWSAYLGVGPNTRQLVANGIPSRGDGTEVWVQQLFRTWAEGSRCFDSVWEVVSIQVQWHNSLHPVRAQPDITLDTWKQHPNSAWSHAVWLDGAFVK